LLPRERQSLMFSATFSEEIKRLAANFLREPVLVEVSQRNSPASNVRQELVHVHESEKSAALLSLLRERDLAQVLVFVNTKIGARRLARQLQQDGINADAIHGDKTQDERMKALEAFKAGTIRVLVATDVAARGLDITELPGVINYDVPFAPEDYIHRIGRTGRAGALGVAITIASGADDRAVSAIEKLIKCSIVPVAIALASAPRRPAREAGRDGTEGLREPGRGRAPASRDGRAREERRGGAGHERPRAAPVDDFFLKPYEPNAGTAAASVANDAPVAATHDSGMAPAPRDNIDRKPARRGALLGGLKR
jgi:ATP-dependent RNA helicase RhlE